MPPILLLVALACTEGTVTIDPLVPTDGEVTEPPVPTVEPRPESCANGIDDDQDGAIDCDDTDCFGHEACPGTGYPPDTLIRDIPVPEWAQICGDFAIDIPQYSVTCADGIEATVEGRTANDWFSDCFSTFSTADRWTCDATYGDFVTVATWEVDPCEPPLLEALAIEACQQQDCSTIFDTYPLDGSDDVYHRTSLRWTLDAPSSAPVVGLVRQSNGAAISGTGRWAGNTWVWTPDQPLRPGTTYQATFSACSQTVGSTFTTNDIGTPVDPPDLVGKTYAFDLGANDVTYIQPPGVGGLLQSQFSNFDFQLLLGITTASPTSLELLLGGGNTVGPTSQQLWFPTFDLSSGFSANPYFSTTPIDLDVPFGNVAMLTLNDLRFQGSVSPTSDLLGGLTLTASVDTRQLSGFLGGQASVCALVPVFGITCEACPDGSGSFCLPIEVVQAAAVEVPGLTLVPVASP